MKRSQQRSPPRQLSQHTSAFLIDKLYTNYVPTDGETKAVKETLVGAVGKLHSFENEISRLQARLDNLLSSRETVGKVVGAHRQLLTPARRLFPEILQEIFYYCLPDSHNSVMSRRQAPLLLGQVCSQWRQVAYSTPKLWTSIHIIIPSFRDAGRDSERTRRQAISAWLSRSGNLPLSISVYSSTSWSTDGRTPANARLQPYLGLILPFIRRWKSVYLNLNHFDWAELFNTYSASDLPWLERFHISGDELFGTSFDPMPFDITAPARENGVLLAPRLRVLSMPMYRAQILQFPIRWHELTGLDMSWFSNSLDEVVRALTLCSNIEFCSITVPGPGGVPSAGIQRKLALPKLRTLCISSRSDASENSQRLLENMYTPELRHLSYDRRVTRSTSIEQEKNTLERLSSTLSSFFGRLVYPLQELELCALSISEESVHQMLSLLPGLKRLSLRCQGRSSLRRSCCRISHVPPLPLFTFSDWQLARFTPQGDLDAREVDIRPCDDVEDQNPLADSPICFCPELEVFHCTGAMFSDAEMMNFLRSRSVHHRTLKVAHLRQVDISFLRGWQTSKETIDQIQALREETGVVVNLKYEPFSKSFTGRSKYSPFDGLPVDLLSNKPPKSFGF